MKKINLKVLISPKVLRGLIIALLLVTCVTSGTFYILKEKERKLKIFTQKQLIQTIQAKKIVEANLTKTIDAKEIVEEELANEKEHSLALGNELIKKEDQIALTLDNLEKEITQRREVEARLLIVMEERRALEAKLSDFETVELEKIIIKPLSRLDGNVLTVNKEHGFIVVDLGKVNDLKIGDILSIYRSDELVGKAEVQRVAERMSCAAILPEWEKVEFKENDEARKLEDLK